MPRTWLAEARTPGPEVLEAFARIETAAVLPGGWYRNQFSFIPGRCGGPVFLCLGIRGQLVYVDRAARTVVAKMSSWPEAQNSTYLIDILRACGAIAAHLSS